MLKNDLLEVWIINLRIKTRTDMSCMFFTAAEFLIYKKMLGMMNLSESDY